MAKESVLKKWTKPSNYCGDTFESYFVGIGRHRDSNTLENCNFEALLERLGGETPEPDDADAAWQPDVMVSRASHWAVGWVEQILVHEKALPKLKILKKALMDLEDYPVLDDGAFMEAEAQEQEDSFECYKDDFVKEILEFLGVKPPKAKKAHESLLELARELYAEACGYYGQEDAWVSAEKIPLLLRDAGDFHRIEKNVHLKACLKKIAELEAVS